MNILKIGTRSFIEFCPNLIWQMKLIELIWLIEKILQVEILFYLNAYITDI